MFRSNLGDTRYIQKLRPLPNFYITLAASETILIRQFRRPSSHTSNYTLFKMQKRLILFFINKKKRTERNFRLNYSTI